jgi:hypothetical protein
MRAGHESSTERREIPSPSISLKILICNALARLLPQNIDYKQLNGQSIDSKRENPDHSGPGRSYFSTLV